MRFTRGDTKRFKFRRKDEKGNVILEKSEKIWFTVKKNPYTKEILIQKTLQDIIFDENGYYHVVLNPKDTQNLKYIEYACDIQTENKGHVYTIYKSPLILDKEVTFGNTDEVEIEDEDNELEIEVENENIIIGTNNYLKLKNKPSINGKELTGNRSLEELGFILYDDTEIKDELSKKQPKGDYATKEETNKLIDNVKNGIFKRVDVLPEVGETNVIYLLPNEKHDENNIYDEFIYIENDFEKIGSTKIDLSGYALKNEILRNYEELENLPKINGEILIDNLNVPIPKENNFLLTIEGAFNTQNLLKGERNIQILSKIYELYKNDTSLRCFILLIPNAWSKNYFLLDSISYAGVNILLEFRNSDTNYVTQNGITYESRTYKSLLITENVMESQVMDGSYDIKYTPIKRGTSSLQFPVEKKYVDDKPTTYAGYDATKTQILKNVNGTLTWIDEE